MSNRRRRRPSAPVRARCGTTRCGPGGPGTGCAARGRGSRAITRFRVAPGRADPVAQVRTSSGWPLGIGSSPSVRERQPRMRVSPGDVQGSGPRRPRSPVWGGSAAGGRRRLPVRSGGGVGVFGVGADAKGLRIPGSGGRVGRGGWGTTGRLDLHRNQARWAPAGWRFRRPRFHRGHRGEPRRDVNVDRGGADGHRRGRGVFLWLLQGTPPPLLFSAHSREFCPGGGTEGGQGPGGVAPQAESRVSSPNRRNRPMVVGKGRFPLIPRTIRR